ncbi:MAG TPA: hypothetical protein VNC61_04245 [Acidimicrobiales bacterium]|nr:hypothetical protein [Acidimicrobiales bacterium]
MATHLTNVAPVVDVGPHRNPTNATMAIEKATGVANTTTTTTPARGRT